MSTKPSWIFRQCTFTAHRSSLKPVRFAALICCVLPVLVQLPVQGQTPASAQGTARSDAVASSPTAEEHDTDKQNMLAIYKALKAYQADHRKLPDWLSDL